MELFIQIRNGQPFEHPIFGDNFRQAFPNIDPDNLPESFARFVRVEAPAIGIYDMYEGVTYEWQDGLVTDVHHVRAMTAEEVKAKQDAAKASWEEHGYASWVFDEAICAFKAPVAYPTDGKIYRWDEPTVSWTEVSDDT
jgi:hypothetical protein